MSHSPHAPPSMQTRHAYTADYRERCLDEQQASRHHPGMIHSGASFHRWQDNYVEITLGWRWDRGELNDFVRTYTTTNDNHNKCAVWMGAVCALVTNQNHRSAERHQRPVDAVEHLQQLSTVLMTKKLRGL